MRKRTFGRKSREEECNSRLRMEEEGRKVVENKGMNKDLKEDLEWGLQRDCCFKSPLISHYTTGAAILLSLQSVEVGLGLMS